MESLGFTVNQEKSNLIPAWQIQFLRFALDSTLMKFFLPEEKIQGISQMCQNLLEQHKVTIWKLSQLLDRHHQLLSAALHYQQLQQLQQLKIKSFRRFKAFDTLVTLDQGAIQDLQWCKDHLTAGNHPAIPGSGDRDRCLAFGLGCSLQGNEDW